MLLHEMCGMGSGRSGCRWACGGQLSGLQEGEGQPALARTRQGCVGFDAEHAFVGGCWPSVGSCADRFLDGAGMLAVLHSSMKVSINCAVTTKG